MRIHRQADRTTDDTPAAGGGPSRPLRLNKLGVMAIFLLAVSLAVGIVPRFQRAAELRAAVEDPQSRLLPVSVVVPRPAPPTTELNLPGNVQANQETPIYARVNGYLRRWLVDIGDRVDRGRVLAEIDTPELDQQLSQARAVVAQAQASLAQTGAGLLQARATLRQTQANLEFARATATRWKQLLVEGAVSQQDADQYQTAFNAAQANVDGAQANVGALEANVVAAKANVGANEANVRQLEALQSFQRVTAPYTGIVTSRTVDNGALITAGSSTTSVPLFKMAQADTLRILVNVPQTFARSIMPGQSATVVLKEFPGRIFSGKVSRDAGALDPTSRTLLAEVIVANGDLALKPGMYAQVKLSVMGPDPPLLVPAAALQMGADGPHVAVVRNDHTVHLQKVDLGRDLGATVEVTSGLEGDERLIVNAPDGLKEGITVRPQGA